MKRSHNRLLPLALISFLLGGAAWAFLGAPGWPLPETDSLDRIRLALCFLLYAAVAFGLTYGPQLWNRARAELILTLVSVAVGLLLLEGMFRLLAPDAETPRLKGISSRALHHIYPPHTRMSAGLFENEETWVMTNEDGLRTNYSRQSFLDHSERIIVAGDSFVFGLGVQQEQAGPQQLETILRELQPGRDVAVLNAGIVSYSPLLIESEYEHLLKHYRPTQFFLCLDTSDIGDDYRYSNESREGESGREYLVPNSGPPPTDLGPVINRIVRPFVFEPLLVPMDLLRGQPPYIKREYDYYKFQLEIGGVTETNRYFIYRHPLEQTRPYFEFTYEVIERLAKRVESDGASFTLVILPRYHHWSDRESPENWEAREYSTSETYQFEYFRFFEEKTATSTFPIVDLLPNFKTADRFPLTFPKDAHFNATGHRFLAEQLSEWVE